jgi:DHA1 family multidrug resistance protein-like MFS transporter
MISQLIRRPTVLVLCSINLIVTMGYGLIMPVMPFYAESLGASATQLGLLFASYSITQFLFSPFWGRMSDRTGRRPIILWGLFGFAITFVMLGFAKSLIFLFSARLLGGALSSASGPASMASMADVTNDQERGGGMALLGATSGLGIVLGPTIGGYLTELSIQIPFFFAAGITFIILIASYALLPESLDRTTRDPTYSLESQQSTSQSTITLRSLPEPVGYLLVLNFVVNLASAILESIFALFLQAKLGFGGKEVGLSWSVAGISMVVTQGFLVGPWLQRWGEIPLIYSGLLINAASYFIILSAWNLPSLLIIMAFMSILGAGLRPAILTFISKRTSVKDQGFVQGQQNRFMALGRVVGPFTGGFLFDTAGISSPFYAGGIIFLGALVISLYKLKWRKS